jgi:hypothetical protein
MERTHLGANIYPKDQCDSVELTDGTNHIVLEPGVWKALRKYMFKIDAASENRLNAHYLKNPLV